MFLNLTRSLAPIYSPKEARFGLLQDEKLRHAIMNNPSSFFSADNIASMTDFPELHFSEVMNSGISRG